MASPDLEKSIKLSDLRKLVKEYDEKKEFGTFEKQTTEQTKIQVELLERIRNLGKTGVDFVGLYNRTEEKRRLEDQKKAKESLQKDGNFKAFLFQQTEGLRKTLHASMDIKGADLGKGVVKGLSTFGLFGKFDTSGLIRKFDEYKAFSMERKEKVLDIKMLEKIEQMILKENKNMDDVKHFLELNGLTNSKIADLVIEFNKGYKESVKGIIHQGVLRHKDIGDIIGKLESKSLIGNESLIEVKPEEPSEKLFQGAEKKEISTIGDTSIIEKASLSSEEIFNELVYHGTILNEMNESLKGQMYIMDEELRLTEEDRNRKKGEKDKNESKSDGFFSNLNDKFLGGIFNGIGEKLINSFGSFLGTVACPLLVIAIGTALTKIAWDWSKANASETETKNASENLKYGGFTKGEEALAKGHGINTELYTNSEELQKAINEARSRGVKGDTTEYKKLTEEEKRQMVESRIGKTLPDSVEIAGSEDVAVQIARAKENARRNAQIKETQTIKSNEVSRGNEQGKTENNTQINVQQKQGYRSIPTETGVKG